MIIRDIATIHHPPPTLPPKNSPNPVVVIIVIIIIIIIILRIWRSSPTNRDDTRRDRIYIYNYIRIHSRSFFYRSGGDGVGNSNMIQFDWHQNHLNFGNGFIILGSSRIPNDQ